MRENPDRRVQIVEVGPRDGLQNEAAPVPTAAKITFVEALAAAGASVVEATSFVNPRAVPQLADAEAVLAGIVRRPGTRYLALVPNERGLDRALAAGLDAVALFTAATDAFAEANVGTTIDGTFARFAPVAERARAAGCWLRGYVSVAFGCPYAGSVGPEAAVTVAERLFALGCDEVALADTIGSGRPDEIALVVERAAAVLPLDRLAIHLHDTGGRGLANAAAALAAGVRILDASAGGLGGCPFAPGAPGNLATEKLLDALHTDGWETGIDAAAVRAAVAGIRPWLAAAATAA